MKKIFLIIILTATTFSYVFSQTPEKEIIAEKDYSVYLPQAGDFSLGVDMGNFIEFIGSTIFGNLVNRVEDASEMQIGDRLNAVQAFQSDIFGKYFLTDTRALRARLGIGINNSTIREFIKDDFAAINDPFSEVKTVDTRIQRFYSVELGVGMEFRRSLWRVQGYVGGEVFGGYSHRNLSFEYGNNITAVNQNPSMAQNWLDENGNIENISSANGNRILNKNKINTYNYGLGLFVGADYFISRNLSFGVEFKLEGRAFHTGEVSAITEGWRLDNVYTKEELVTPRTRGFSLVPITYLSFAFYF